MGGDCAADHFGVRDAGVVDPDDGAFPFEAMASLDASLVLWREPGVHDAVDTLVPGAAHVDLAYAVGAVAAFRSFWFEATTVMK